MSLHTVFSAAGAGIGRARQVQAAALLASVDARYRGVTERIGHDRGFLAYVAQQAQLADQG